MWQKLHSSQSLLVMSQSPLLALPQVPRQEGLGQLMAGTRITGGQSPEATMALAQSEARSGFMCLLSWSIARLAEVLSQS